MLLRDIASGEGRVISLPAQLEQCIGIEAHLFGDGLRLLVSGALDVKAALPGKRRDRLPSGSDALRCAAMPASPSQGDRLDGEQQAADDEHRPQRAAVDGDFSDDSAETLPEQARRRLVGHAAAKRRFALGLVVVTQRIGKRHRRLTHQGLRIGRSEILVLVGNLRFLRCRVERHPSVTVQLDLHPSGHIVAGEFRGGGFAMLLGAAVTDLALVVLRQEAQHHAARQAETAGHKRHRGSVLLAVSNHRTAGEQLVDTIVAVTGSGWVIAIQTMGEPAGFPELVGKRLRGLAALGLAARNRGGQLIHAIGHILRLGLADGGSIRLGDLLIRRRPWNDAGFRIGQSRRGARRVDRRHGVGVVVERIGVRRCGELHAGSRAGHRQPIVAQTVIDREFRGEPLAGGVVCDGIAHTMVVGGIRSHGGIGQVPHIAVETVHNRQTHRGTGRQIVDGQQHIVLMVLDIRTHAAQRAGVIVRAQRRIIMVAQNGAVLPDHQASADRHSRSQQHDDYGTEPTAQFQQFPTRADPNHQHDRHNRADRHTVEAA